MAFKSLCSISWKFLVLYDVCFSACTLSYPMQTTYFDPLYHTPSTVFLQLSFITTFEVLTASLRATDVTDDSAMPPNVEAYLQVGKVFTPEDFTFFAFTSQLSKSTSLNQPCCMKLQIWYKNTNHQQMQTQSFIINCNTLLHVSTLLGHLQGELFVIVTLYSSVRMCCWLCTEWTLCGPGPRVHASKNNAVHSQQHILTQLLQP
jgi:hypothetical protein